MNTPVGKHALVALITAALLITALPAQANKRWLLPSHSSVSEPQWITVDASISNQIFAFGRTFPVDALSITGPDGKPAKVDNIQRMHTRSVFDVQLDQPGSYRIRAAKPGYFVIYEINGEQQRERGNDLNTMLADLSDDARNVNVIEIDNRLESIVTLGAPNRTALTPTGKGLEVDMLTHPNDLYAGETAQWRLLIDGKPAAGLDVELVPAGTRYRDSQQDWTVTSDAQGLVEINWPSAGRFFLEIGARDNQPSHSKADQRRLLYQGTVEVLPM